MIAGSSARGAEGALRSEGAEGAGDDELFLPFGAPALLLVGALLLPVDIGVRRLMISRAEWAAFAGAVYSATLGRLIPQRRQAEPAEGMGRLLSAKMTAARRMGATAEEQAPERSTREQAAPAEAAPALLRGRRAVNFR